MDIRLQQAASLIKNSKHCIALTGAGISCESGIPDFRGKNGLWTKYNPEEYVHINGFKKDRVKVWRMVFDLLATIKKAAPNDAHIALADLEKRGILKAVITQNIDNLHTDAGSSEVIEFHGNTRKLVCTDCGRKFSVNDFTLDTPPLCTECNLILKPDFVFFGEMIPEDALERSFYHAERADLLLVIGTSAVVYPAASIPQIAKENGAKIIEFNLEPTVLTDRVTDILIEGPAVTTFKELMKLI